jgi:ATP-dependent exoDNAse (exonuclease V) alpha subunit
MAIYHLQIKSISRGDGRSATGAAAYRSGERIRDERTGKVHNHTARRDVAHKEIVVPKHLEGREPEWARDRARLWNAVEQSESRRNARLAREYELALPAELTGRQRIELARAFAEELANRHKTIVDVAIHDPRAAGDARNHHAHLLETTREVTGDGFGAKAGLDMGSRARQQYELPSGLVEFNTIRERWAAAVNDALHSAGLAERVDHRSYRERGIDREPLPHIPYAAVQAERRGLRSEFAEQLRERYRQRVQQRLERSRHSQLEDHGQWSEATHGPDRGQTLEQIRQRAREDWKRIRRQSIQFEENEQSLEDKDLSM